MGRPVRNWVGQQVNELTVLERDTTKPSGNGCHVFWICRCSCGKILSVSSNKLAKGQKSCGHLNNFSNDYYIGKEYGLLTVVGLSEEKDAKGRLKLICECDCGNVVIRTIEGLRNKNKLSCCDECKKHLQDDIDNPTNFKGLSQEEIQSRIGQKFGRLTVLERTEQRSASGERLWRCRCDCGNEKMVRWSNLLHRRVSSCGCLVSKGEQEIKSILLKHNIDYKDQHIFSDLISSKGKPLMFDFAIFRDNKLFCLIEYQGRQHYEKDSKFFDKEAQERDQLKRDYCNKHSIKLIEIPYWDFDRLDWNYLKDKCNL